MNRRYFFPKKDAFPGAVLRALVLGIIWTIVPGTACAVLVSGNEPDTSQLVDSNDEGGLPEEAKSYNPGTNTGVTRLTIQSKAKAQPAEEAPKPPEDSSSWVRPKKTHPATVVPESNSPVVKTVSAEPTSKPQVVGTARVKPLNTQTSVQVPATRSVQIKGTAVVQRSAPDQDPSSQETP